MKTTILVLLAVLVASACWSDGNLLLDMCLGQDPELKEALPDCPLAWTMCGTYIQAVRDLAEWRGLICTEWTTPGEDRVVQHEAREVVVAYLIALRVREPQLLYQRAAPLILAAFREHWPCR